MKDRQDDEDVLKDADRAQAPAAMETAFRERLRSIKSVTERRTLGGLARELGKLPVEVARAALETSAALAGVSLRASVEFLRAVPEASRVLETEELRAWGEMGRRLAMADTETAVSFFAAGVEDFARVPKEARPLVFQVCSRQMTLSSSVATETFRRVPALSESIRDAQLLRSILEVASEISRRSAKHSADFLSVTPQVAAAWRKFVDDEEEVARGATLLASTFAIRAGGIASDAWAALPVALARLSTGEALRLMTCAGDFLERGGGAALHVLTAGGDVLRAVPSAFDDWIELLWIIAAQGNAALVAFVRTSPVFFQAMAAEADVRAPQSFPAVSYR